MHDPCTVGVRMERSLREKARFLARLGGRSLTAHVRHLVRVDIRSYEEEHGPIPLPDEEKERTP